MFAISLSIWSVISLGFSLMHLRNSSQSPHISSAYMWILVSNDCMASSDLAFFGEIFCKNFAGLLWYFSYKVFVLSFNAPLKYLEYLSLRLLYDEFSRSICEDIYDSMSTFLWATLLFKNSITFWLALACFMREELLNGIIFMISLSSQLLNSDLQYLMSNNQNTRKCRVRSNRKRAHIFIFKPHLYLATTSYDGAVQIVFFRAHYLHLDYLAQLHNTNTLFLWELSPSIPPTWLISQNSKSASINKGIAVDGV